MDIPVADPNDLPPHPGGTGHPEDRDIQTLLGPPPLFYGEDKEAYEKLLARTRMAVRPRDVIEEFWVRDVVNLVWDALRLRRLKAGLLDAAAEKAFIKVLIPDSGYELAKQIVNGWAARDPESVQEAEELLQRIGFSMDTVMAEALRKRLDPIERIERLITDAESRRNSMLREIDRHRSVLANALRNATDNIRDAEFTEIDGDATTA